MDKHFISKKEYQEMQIVLSKQFLELIDKQVRFSKMLIKSLETNTSPKNKTVKCVNMLKGHLEEMRKEMKWFQKKLAVISEWWNE